MPGSPSRRHGVIVTATVLASLALAGCTGAPAGSSHDVYPGLPGTAPRIDHLTVRVALREVLGGPIPAAPASGGNASADRQSTDPTEQGAAALALDCTGPGAFPPDVDPARPLVACDDDRSSKYLVGPEFVELGPETGVELSPDGRSVLLTPDPSASRVLTEYSAANVGKALALVVGSRVVAAPVINGPISGPLEIFGARDPRTLVESLTGT